MSISYYLNRSRKQCALVLFWILLNSLCVFGNGLASAKALTSLVSLQFSSFLFWCCIQLGINLIWMLQINYATPAKEKAIQEMNQLMRSDLTENLSKTDFYHFKKNSQETYTSWLTYDIETINDMGFEVLEYMLSQAFNIIFGMIALIGYDVSFSLTIAFFAILMTITPKLFSHQLTQKAVQFTQKNEALIHEISNRLSGFRVLANANQLTHLHTKILKTGDDYAQSKIAYSQSFGHMMALQNGTSFISQIAIITQAGWLFSLNRVPLGTVSSAPYFASIIFSSLTGFFANYTELKNCQAIFDKWRVLSSEQATAAQSITFAHELTLNQVRVSFSETKDLALPQFSVLPGQKIALIGPSGSGKSSLLAALLKEIPMISGQICWDKQDAKNLSLESIQNLIGLVPQDAYLFEDTLRYNLTLDKTVSDQAIMDVLAQLDLADWLKQDDLGLESPISPTKLSGGQVQRLCLARALLADKPVLLLDEATAAIEPQLRQQVERFLLQLPKTVIMVTHHLTPEIQALCDQVISFNDYFPN